MSFSRAEGLSAIQGFACHKPFSSPHSYCVRFQRVVMCSSARNSDVKLSVQAIPDVLGIRVV